MGLREKVALLVLALLLEQLVCVQCLSNTKNLKNLQKPYKHGQLTKRAKNGMSVSSKDDAIKRAFNFPEVDYPLPPTFISSKYFNANLQQTSNPPENSMKNVLPKSSLKKKRKYSNIGIKTPKKTTGSNVPEHKLTQKPYSFNNDVYFPDVEYPQDASDLWKNHHWDRVLNIKPEMIKNVKETSMNNKPTNKFTAKTIKDGVKRYGIKYPKIYQITSNMYRFNATNLNTGDDLCTQFNKTIGCERNKNKTVFVMNDTESTDACTGVKTLFAYAAEPLTQCDEVCTSDDLYTVSQVTPLPADLLSPYQEYVSEPSIVLPSTVARDIVCKRDENQLDFQILESSDYNNTIVDDNCAQDTIDGMGYTVMYPEVFSSLTTSTMAPMDCNEAGNIWMCPELDNHTVNMYSDELEQYYILVND